MKNEKETYEDADSCLLLESLISNFFRKMEDLIETVQVHGFETLIERI